VNGSQTRVCRCLGWVFGATPDFYDVPDGFCPCRFFELVIANPFSEIGMGEDVTVFESFEVCVHYNIVDPHFGRDLGGGEFLRIDEQLDYSEPNP